MKLIQLKGLKYVCFLCLIPSRIKQTKNFDIRGVKMV